MSYLRQLSFVLLLGLVSCANARGLFAVNDNSPACDSCVMVVRILDDYLCDPSASDYIMNLIENQICPISGNKELCESMATSFVPVMLEWLHDAVTPEQMCSAAGVCGATGRFSTVKPTKRTISRDNGLQCPLCEYIIGGLQTILKDPSVSLSIEQAAEKVCVHLPSNVAASCTTFVDTYEPMIAAYIKSVNATMACALMGACPATLSAIRPPPLTPALVQHAAKFIMVTQGNNLLAPSNDMCDTCKMSVLEAHSLVTDPTIQMEIIGYSKIMCDSMVPDQKELCRSLVDAYAPMMFDQLAKVLLPDFLCVQLHFCNPSSLVDTMVASFREGLNALLSSKIIT